MHVCPHNMQIVAVRDPQVKCWQSPDVLEQVCSTCSSQAACCLLYSVMLLTETFEMRKCLLTISQADPRYNTSSVLKTYDLVVHWELYHIANSFCKNVLKIVTLAYVVNSIFYQIFPFIISIFLWHIIYRNTQVKLYVYAYLYINCLILHTVHRISRCPHTDQICWSCLHHMHSWAVLCWKVEPSFPSC
jgi:hypothetical protein